MALSRRLLMAGGGAIALLGGTVTAAPQRTTIIGRIPAKASKRMTDDEIDAVFAQAAAELHTKTADHIAKWDYDGAHWDVDLEAGTITFSNKRGWTIVAPVQVVGTRSRSDDTFLWAWDHPSIPAARAETARLVRAFGDANGLEALTTRKIAATEKEAWELTALAVHLANAAGAYRGPTGNADVFMTFGPVTITKR